jgi:TP53 regulating kinase-like protein
MIIAQGAEAVLSREDTVLKKDRIKKSYRIKGIDERLRKRRTRAEAKLLRTARRTGVAVPGIVDEADFSIKMDFVEGEKVRDILGRKNCQEIGRKVAKSIAMLHDNDIIHGDLTTSNMILKNNEVYFIDFGLGFHSSRIEDKAVDLYLLHQALASTHFDILEETWETILKVYEENSKEAKKVIKTLGEIEKRGRYRKR